ncbi:MAG: tRNA lysidine(34) synthetase TilS [Alicyclobacillaceae bacterium]|nr:tRNA lysidine(34) synthetase TilS [Alicyclobacillaceae bacterium]
MLDRLLNWFAQHPEIGGVRRILAAVSGGVDSMVLLDLLARARDRLGFTLVACHIDHGLRPESAEEQGFVRSRAEALGVEFAGVEVDVKRRADATGESIQMAARALRYEALAEQARKVGADAVALAHHADDQAETVLMRILRGTSTAGLGGMAEVRPWAGLWWLRPLLGTWKQELRTYAREKGVPYREDPSNQSNRYWRNRIRRELMPLLESSYQPRIREHLVQLASLARDDEELLREMALRAFEECTSVRGASRVVDLEKFGSLPVALQRRVITLILYYPSGGAPENDSVCWDSVHVETVRRLAATGRTGGRADLPGGWQVRREYGELILVRADTGRPAEGPGAATRLAVPGRTSCPAFGVVIDAALVPISEAKRRIRIEMEDSSGVKPSTPSVVYFDWGEMEGRPLFVRTRRSGDRFEPFGLGGRKKLKEVWIDDKIPHRLRDRWPLVTDGEDVLWIVGWRRSRKWPVTAQTESVLRLEAVWTDEEIRRWLDRRLGRGQ